MPSPITRLYQQFDPAKPLQAGDPRYVPGTGVRGPGDLILRIANSLRRSDDAQHLLFAGHRGAGKSTELLRLHHALIQSTPDSDPFFVVYFEADAEDVDVNDVDFPDLLLAVIRQVAKKMREAAHVELRPTWLNRFLDDLRGCWGAKCDSRRPKWT